MHSLTSISVTFLLAAIVSVIAKSAAYVQEIDIDIVPKENTDDSGVGGRRDVDDEVRPYQMPARRRRMLTAFDRHAVVDTLNRLRRSLGAPDMYYAVRYIFSSFYIFQARLAGGGIMFSACPSVRSFVRLLPNL